MKKNHIGKEQKQKIVLFALMLTVFLLVLGGIIGMFHLARHPKTRQTMVTSNAEMQILQDLKDSMKDRQLTVILDAGHGGNDVGTGDETYWEKDINWDIVQNMEAMLTYCGVAVLLTRNGDETVPLDDRSAFANEHEEASYYISVHCNFCEGDSSVSGLECYYWDGSEPGRAYAQAILSAAEDSGKITVRGLKTDNFHVLRETKMPAVLIETGYLSNSEDKKQLYDENYQKTLALYLTKGIVSGALQ